MSTDVIYRDEKGIINYTCNLSGIIGNKKLVVKHKEKEYNLETNLRMPLYNLLSEAQKENFEEYFINRYKDTKFKVKLHEVNLNHEGYIYSTEEGQDKLLSELLEYEVSRFLENTKKPEPIIYEAKIKEIKKISDITVEFKSKNYKVFLDLLDTDYIGLKKEDQTLIDNVFKRKISELIKNKNKIKVVYENDINYSQKADIKYFEDNNWKSLKEEMKLLIKPVEERTKTNRNIFNAIVSNVIDGDTIEVFDGKQKKRIRLDDLDAKESQQEHGYIATRYLTKKIYGKEIKIAYRENDDYGRMVATLYFENKKTYGQDYNINKDLVRNGHAHAKGLTYKSDERKAKKENLGIWQYDGADPEIFRKNKEYFLNKKKEKLNKKHWRNKQERREKKA